MTVAAAVMMAVAVMVMMVMEWVVVPARSPYSFIGIAVAPRARPSAMLDWSPTRVRAQRPSIELAPRVRGDIRALQSSSPSARPSPASGWYSGCSGQPCRSRAGTWRRGAGRA